MKIHDKSYISPESYNSVQTLLNAHPYNNMLCEYISKQCEINNNLMVFENKFYNASVVTLFSLLSSNIKRDSLYILIDITKEAQNWENESFIIKVKMDGAMVNINYNNINLVQSEYKLATLLYMSAITPMYHNTCY